jgi:hypothetical protein
VREVHFCASVEFTLNLGRVLKLAETLDFVRASPLQNQVLKQTLDLCNEQTKFCFGNRGPAALPKTKFGFDL